LKTKKTRIRKRQIKVIRQEDTRTVIYIIGDAANVEEYARICAVHGYSVQCHCPGSSEPLASLDPASVREEAHVPANASFALELTNVDLEQKRLNLELLDRMLPPTTAIVSSSITVTATEQASWIRHKHRLVGCSVLPTIADKPLVEIAPTVFSPAATVQVVVTFFRSIGKEIELVQDRIGMVFPRILCQMINETAFALQEEVSTPQDLDLAMTVAANYPVGPIAWAEKIGLAQVCAVLRALQRDLGEDRTRIAPLLTQMALSGTWWKQT
jgi:3-hydroxybutyryl-CoA dehydrogenase